TELWVLLPDEPTAAGGLRVAAGEAVPAWARRMMADIAALKRMGWVERAAEDAEDLVTSGPGIRPPFLHARKHSREGQLPLETDALGGHDPPIPRGSLVWVDPERPPLPGDAVVVELDGVTHPRVVGADGVTLESWVPTAVPLRLDAVDRL